jgi:hypothetical protein
MELLIDYFRLDPVQVISESTESGTIKIRGIFGRAGEFNKNNRRYPKPILEREVTRLMPLVTENRLLGELDHPDSPTVKLTNASHMVTKLYWQGDVLIGESQLLNTPAGKVAQQLIKDGVRIGVSSRGLGSLKPCQDSPGKFEVNEDFRAVTFDLVADPSTRGAHPSQVNESVLLEKTKKAALNNKVLLNLLESRLNTVKDDRISKIFEKKDPCWKGYQQVGMKMKGKRKVPNCVPSKPVNEAKRTSKVNPWAVCNASLGKGRDPKKFERCVMDVKSKADLVEAYTKLIKNILVEGKGVMPKMKMGVHKSRAGGLTQKGVEAYRRANPGSKLKTAVTTDPSKLKKGSKSAKRRKSFCARMGGMKRSRTSSKTANDPNSRINKALRKWNC